jgi:hypothetical protein
MRSALFLGDKFMKKQICILAAAALSVAGLGYLSPFEGSSRLAVAASMGYQVNGTVSTSRPDFTARCHNIRNQGLPEFGHILPEGSNHNSG